MYVHATGTTPLAEFLEVWSLVEPAETAPHDPAVDTLPNPLQAKHRSPRPLCPAQYGCYLTAVPICETEAGGGHGRLDVSAGEHREKCSLQLLEGGAIIFCLYIFISLFHCTCHDGLQL